MAHGLSRKYLCFGQFVIACIDPFPLCRNSMARQMTKCILLLMLLVLLVPSNALADDKHVTSTDEKVEEVQQKNVKPERVQKGLLETKVVEYKKTFYIT